MRQPGSFTGWRGWSLDHESGFLIKVSVLRAGLGSGCRAGVAGFHVPGGSFLVVGSAVPGQVGTGSARTVCQAPVRSVVQGQSWRRWSQRFR